MATLNDGTVYVTGRTADGTKLHKITSSPNKSYVGKYVDSDSLNKMSKGGTPTFYGNSLGIASWQSSTPSTPAPTPAPAPTPPPSSGGGYTTQSTNGSTSTPDPNTPVYLPGIGLTTWGALNGTPPYSDTDADVAAWLQQAQQYQNDPAPPPNFNTDVTPPINQPAALTPAQMAAKIFPNDANAQQAFVRSWNEGLAYEAAGTRTRAETERAALLAGNQTMTNPLSWLNNFLTNNPTGQVLAPILENGAGVTTGVGSGAPTGTTVHTGMPAPTTTPTQPDWDSVIDNAVSNYTPPPTTINGGTPNAGTITNGTPTLNNPVYTPSNGLPPPTTPAPTSPAPTTTTGTTAPVTGTTTPPSTTTGGAGTGGTATEDHSIPWWAGPASAGAGGLLGWWGTKEAGETQAAAAKEAATIQANAQIEANNLQKEMFEQIRTDQTPWRNAGTAALGKLGSFFTDNPDFGMSQFQQDPGYSFRLSEGMKALQNSAAARGNLLSGNTLKGIQDFGQQSASQEYQNAFNRYQTQRGQKLNALQSLAGVGQSAVQQVGQAGQNYANQAGNALVGAANSQAGGMTSAANAQASGYMGGTNALINALSQGYNNYLGQQYVNKLGGQ